MSNEPTKPAAPALPPGIVAIEAKAGAIKLPPVAVDVPGSVEELPAPDLQLGDMVTYWVERYGKLHAQPAMVVGGPWTQTCANLRVFLDGTNVADDVTPPFTQKEMAWGSAWRTSVTLATEPKAGFFTR